MHASSDFTLTSARRMLQPPPKDGGSGGGMGSPLGTMAGIGLSGGVIYNALDG